MLIRGARTVKFTAARAAEELLNWLYPPKYPVCIVCQRPLPQVRPSRSSDIHYPPGICLFCLTGQPCDLQHPVLGKIRVRNRNVPVVCAATYEGWLRDALRHWKYDGTLELTDWFARLMAGILHPDKRPRWDYLIPVPTAVDRIEKRGYDHVGLLARKLARNLRIPLKLAIERIHLPGAKATETYTQSQTSRSALERARALAGQFRLKDNINDLCGKNVLLVDDVVTTGATLQACADVLANEGIESIHALAIAHVQ